MTFVWNNKIYMINTLGKKKIGGNPILIIVFLFAASIPACGLRELSLTPGLRLEVWAAVWAPSSSAARPVTTAAWLTQLQRSLLALLCMTPLRCTRLHSMTVQHMFAFLQPGPKSYHPLYRTFTLRIKLKPMHMY